MTDYNHKNRISHNFTIDPYRQCSEIEEPLRTVSAFDFSDMLAGERTYRAKYKEQALRGRQNYLKRVGKVIGRVEQLTALYARNLTPEEIMKETGLTYNGVRSYASHCKLVYRDGKWIPRASRVSH